MIDLRIVEIQLETASVYGPCAKQRVDENIECLAQVVPSGDDDAAVTIDKQAEVSEDHISVVEDVGMGKEI